MANETETNTHLLCVRYVEYGFRREVTATNNLNGSSANSNGRRR